MGEPCGLTSHGRYAAKHNPFVYFDDINGWDGKPFQPSAALQRPRRRLLAARRRHRGEQGAAATCSSRRTSTTTCTTARSPQGDAWLSREIPKIMATDAYKNGGVIFLLWDEGGGTLGAGDDPPFIAISPNAKRRHDRRRSTTTPARI